jgi:glycosyltransferase involved in cell wall biosynthesis
VQEAGRTLVVVPAWNESEALPATLAELRVELPDVDVIVVDDGSTDGTARVVRGDATAGLVSLPFNIGVGGAMRTGFLFAQRHGYRAVVQVDADGQHDPAAVARLLAEIDAGADVVVGARFAGVGDYKAGLLRRFAMRFLAVSVSALTHTRLDDVTSGFRASSARAVAVFAHSYPPEYLGDTVESLVIAGRSGLVIRQVPVEMRPRRGGTPSQSAFKSVVYVGRAMLVLGLAVLHRRGEGDDR